MSTTNTDGSTSIPPATGAMPTLLDGTAARPDWNVAAVDYAVGVPSGTSLADPSSIDMSGVSVDAGSHTVTIHGSDVTLSGYDFGLDGGWGVHIDPGASNVTIKNSHFLVGANAIVPINAASGSGNLTLLNNTVDGGGGSGDAVWALANYNGSGTFTAKYNAFVNAPEDAIDFNSGTMTTNVQNNFFNNIGTSPGSHPDPVQYVGVNASNSVEAYNTIYQPKPSGMQGVQLQAQNGSTLSNTKIENNTIVAKDGSSETMSYSVAVIQNAGDTINGATVSNNYIDYGGAYGPFYPPSGSGLTFSGNVNMSTGATIASPDGTSSGGSSSGDTSSGGTSSGGTSSGDTSSGSSSGTASSHNGAENSGNTVSVDQSNVQVSAPADRMLFISGSNNTVDLSSGADTVTDQGGGNTCILPSGSNPAASFTSNILDKGDVLDLRTALASTDWNGSSDTLSKYLSVSSSSDAAEISLAKTAGGHGTTIAHISGAAGLSLDSLLSHAMT
ncbi:MAG: hypothetical protein ACJ8AI_14985 [Rhodopila sp.]|jgi:hypothetical protein